MNHSHILPDLHQGLLQGLLAVRFEGPGRVGGVPLQKPEKEIEVDIPFTYGVVVVLNPEVVVDVDLGDIGADFGEPLLHAYLHEQVPVPRIETVAQQRRIDCLEQRLQSGWLLLEDVFHCQDAADFRCPAEDLLPGVDALFQP